MTSAVLPGGVHAGANHCADDERALCLATKHIAQLGTLVEDHIPADAEEIDEHQLDDGTQAGGSGAYGGADEARLGDGRIQHALAPEFFHQPLRDAKHAAPGVLLLEAADAGSSRDILTHQNNARITLHLLPQRLVDRLGKGQLTNCDSHDLSSPSSLIERA